jgi:nitrite reductase (cytochrome c-552)
MRFLRSGQFWLLVGVFLVAAGLTAGIAALLMNIQTRKLEAVQYPNRVVEIAQNELDPAVWGKNFPIQYDSFRKTETNYGQTPYGGSDPYSKLERNPALIRLWAGYPFSEDHNEERGHYYSLIDQEQTRRVTERNQPAACANCHAAELPVLVEKYGWEEFNGLALKDLLGTELHRGSTCNDCHNPDTMELRISRPAFREAMEARGIDIENASRQEMRTYVCAQCHVEYYFDSERNKTLTFPWTNGTTIEEIEKYYIEDGHRDWQHAETGGPMIKIQHPEFELYTTSLHYRSGVSCADCHMPYIREGSVKVSDHWVRSPLVNIETACQTCHKFGKEQLEERVLIIQNKTAELLHQSEEALLSTIDAIKAAKVAGATDEQLANAMELHWKAQMRWDFISSENSTGFHSPQESARILADSIDLARQAEIEVLRMTGGEVAAAEVASNQ